MPLRVHPFRAAKPERTPFSRRYAWAARYWDGHACSQLVRYLEEGVYSIPVREVASVNRVQLQQLAQTRLLDAASLLKEARWAAAYYLTGYAIEFKSRILRHLGDTGIIFRDQKYLTNLAKCWSHDLVFLHQLGGLEADFGVARGANPTLDAYWGVVKDWKETSRYEDRTEAEARALYEAVTHDPHGVFRWIQTRW